MDRNTITGLVLIFLILITFSYFNKPSQKEIDAMKQRRDSIARVEADRAAEAAKLAVETKENIVLPTDTTIGSVENQLRSMYGAFGVAAQGEEKFVTIENNLMKVTLSTKGGKIYAVELKGYKRYNGEPLVLFEGDSNQFGLNFFSQNKSIKTDNFYFQPSVNENISIIGPEIPTGKEGRENYNENHQGETKSLAMKLDAGDDVSIEYVYTLKHNSYMVGFEIQTNNLKKVAGSNTDYVNFAWAIEMPRQEKMSKFGENRYTTIYYKFNEDEVEARFYGLNFIKLDGNIGCMVNGAGLAMATMDFIKQAGGAPANFLDVGGVATPETISRGFEILSRDGSLKAIFVNIFGGIVRCDKVADGIIDATTRHHISLPVIIRLSGSNVEEGLKTLKASRKNFHLVTDVEQARDIINTLVNN